MPVSIEDMNKPDPLEEAFQSQGLTPLYLTKKLKRELNAKETKVFYDGKEGVVIYSKSLIAWGIRQKARMDAHKLMGHYPADKHELTGKDGGPMEVTLKWPENGNGEH